MKYTCSEDRVEFQIDLSVISLFAVKKAAHKFAGRFSVSSLVPAEGVVNLTLSMQPTKGSESANYTLTALASDFSRELLDQDLRERIADQTGPLRNLLLAEAFSQTSLLASEFESADYLADPLNLSTPNPNSLV